MNRVTLLSAFYIGLAALLVSCASSPPNSARVDLVEPRVAPNDQNMLVAYFNVVPSYGMFDIGDGPRVTNLQQLTFNEKGTEQVSRPAASPTQDAIAYVTFAGGKSSIFRQSLGSQAQSPLISEQGINLTPTFTPDGRFLIFSSDRSGESQSLWRKRSDGAGGITQITSSNSFDWHPTVAADGETIIFQSHRKNNPSASIWSINMNGGLLTQLSTGHSPKVSPDGRRIVFVRRRADGKDQIWSMQIDASGLTQLSAGSSNDRDPSWHPNGRYIVFASDESTGESATSDHNIWIMRADGTKRVQLTTNLSHDDAPVFERRGREIVFRSNRGGSWNLFSFSPDLQ
jgi:TolB protein